MSNDDADNCFFKKNCLSCFPLHALFSFRTAQRNPERELCGVCLFSLCEQLSESRGGRDLSNIRSARLCIGCPEIFSK